MFQQEFLGFLRDLKFLFTSPLGTRMNLSLIGRTVHNTLHNEIKQPEVHVNMTNETKRSRKTKQLA